MHKTTIHHHFSSVLKVEGQQGTSARLVITAVLGRKFKTYSRFVIIKVRNPILCTVKSGPLYVIEHSPGSWDELTSLKNLEGQ